MALTPTAAERAEFSGRRGDTISRRWTRATGTTVYDANSLVVQIRKGSDEYGTLVASSVEAEQSGSVAAITTTGTNLTADPPVIAWQIAADEYVKLPAGNGYHLGLDVTVGGEPREIQRHGWEVLRQTVLRP